MTNTWGTVGIDILRLGCATPVILCDGLRVLACARKRVKIGNRSRATLFSKIMSAILVLSRVSAYSLLGKDRRNSRKNKDRSDLDHDEKIADEVK